MYARVLVTTFSLLLVLMAVPLASVAQLRLARLIGDGMVMQREAAVPVWGWSQPGASITVTFGGATYAAQADADGAWEVRLPAMPAGGPHTMTVASGDERVEVQDILVGDVWIGSGQSNMEWTVKDVNDAQAEIAAADDPSIRHFKVPLSWAEAPEATLAGGSWEVASPATVGDFTAVGYFFARELREHVDVPIGLINTSWGGSRIEPWMSTEALGLDAGEVAAIFEQERAREQEILGQVHEKLGGLPAQDEGLVDGEARWAAPDFDDRSWFTIEVPALWETAGFGGMDGVAWYRTAFDLTDAEAAQGVTLGLGLIDDTDVTWVNGAEVGGMEQAYNVARVYAVPPSALRAGRNVIAVRVEDTGGGGGIAGPPDTVFLETADGRRALPQEWRFMVGEVTVGASGNKNRVPTALWNKMVYPLLPYPVKGVLWYQGESNADAMADAVAYRALFPQMIESWRAAWGQPDLPFLWVQLANFRAPDAEPPPASNWAVLREAQSATLALPHTAQAVIIDIGEADDIHPRNKQDVGARLALAARTVVFGEDIVYSGPTYASHEVRDGRVQLTFDHVGGGLVAQGGPLSGFALAGADGRFVWAEAQIEGDAVVVWSADVPEPVAVRYAWGDNPEAANLYNAEGLPASPFRTDAW